MIKIFPKYSLTVLAFIFLVCQVTVYLLKSSSPSQSELKEKVEFFASEKEEKIAQSVCAKNISGTECWVLFHDQNKNMKWFYFSSLKTLHSSLLVDTKEFLRKENVTFACEALETENCAHNYRRFLETHIDICWPRYEGIKPEPTQSQSTTGAWVSNKHLEIFSYIMKYFCRVWDRVAGVQECDQGGGGPRPRLRHHGLHWRQEPRTDPGNYLQVTTGNTVSDWSSK